MSFVPLFSALIGISLIVMTGLIIITYVSKRIEGNNVRR